MLSLFLFAAILTFVALALWAPFTFEVEFRIGQADTHYAVRWKCLGYDVSLLPIIGKVGRTIQNQFRSMLPQEGLSNPRDVLDKLQELYNHLFGHGRRMRGMLVYFVQEITRLELSVAIGLTDPMFTATTCGGIWAVLGPLMARLKADGRLNCRPAIHVTPQYDWAGVQVSFNCIFRFRLGQIIGDMIRNFATSRAQRMQIKET